MKMTIEERIKRLDSYPNYTSFTRLFEADREWPHYTYSYQTEGQLPVWLVNKNKSLKTCPVCGAETLCLQVIFPDHEQMWIKKCTNKKCGLNICTRGRYKKRTKELIVINENDLKQWDEEEREAYKKGVGAFPSQRISKIEKEIRIGKIKLKNLNITYDLHLNYPGLSYRREGENVYIPYSKETLNKIIKSLLSKNREIKFEMIDYIFDEEINMATFMTSFKEILPESEFPILGIESFPEDIKVVYVYSKLNIKCIRDSHCISAVTIHTINMITGKDVWINVHYCYQCNRFFIDVNALKDIIDMKVQPTLAFAFGKNGNVSMNSQSVLNCLGYNVSAAKSTLISRKLILAWIMDNQILSKATICAYLEHFISYNGQKEGSEEAKQRWIEDKKYVEEYELQYQPEYEGIFTWYKEIKKS